MDLSGVSLQTRRDVASKTQPRDNAGATPVTGGITLASASPMGSTMRTGTTGGSRGRGRSGGSQPSYRLEAQRGGWSGVTVIKWLAILGVAGAALVAATAAFVF